MAMLLVITALLPLLGSVVLFLAPRMEMRAARSLALATVLVTLGLSLVLVAAYRPGVTHPQFAFGPEGGPYGLGWMERPDIRFALGLDGLSLWLFALTAVLMVPTVFASWESIIERAPMHYALLLLLESGLLGLFASLDVILFYIFFEFTLIPLFFLIGIWGGPERRRASVTFFLYTVAGGLLTLLGVIALVVVYYQNSGHLTFSIPELTRGLATLPPDSDWHKAEHWTTSPQALIFLLLFAGFAIKVPMFPFHTWLPLAHVEAPTAGSIVLAGVLLKIGGYGLLRFNMGMTPIGAQLLFPFLATLAIISIIYGALVSLAQTDIKRLVAYSSVSHMGFVVLGMLAMNATGMEGSVIQMVNHGITTGALFACVGVIYERYHTREMAELSGLWERLPLFAFFLILTSLGSAAVPGLNGFVGEFPILTGMFERNPGAAVLGATGMILGAYYLLWMVQQVIFGPLREPLGHAEHEITEAGHAPAVIRPMGWHEITGLTVLMVFVVVIGVYPRPFFDRIKPAVTPIAARFSAPGAGSAPVVLRTSVAAPNPEPVDSEDDPDVPPSSCLKKIGIEVAGPETESSDD
jgi:NADH-quinone oxidoreductase subunit M